MILDLIDHISESLLDFTIFIARYTINLPTVDPSTVVQHSIPRIYPTCRNNITVRHVQRVICSAVTTITHYSRLCALPRSYAGSLMHHYRRGVKVQRLSRGLLMCASRERDFPARLFVPRLGYKRGGNCAVTTRFPVTSLATLPCNVALSKEIYIYVAWS